MPVDNYVVFYIPDEDTKTVTVVRVMYNGRAACKTGRVQAACEGRGNGRAEL